MAAGQRSVRVNQVNRVFTMESRDASQHTNVKKPTRGGKTCIPWELRISHPVCWSGGTRRARWVVDRADSNYAGGDTELTEVVKRFPYETTKDLIVSRREEGSQGQNPDFRPCPVRFDRGLLPVMTDILEIQRPLPFRALTLSSLSSRDPAQALWLIRASGRHALSS